MVRCANCGAENSERARFCQNCGAPLSTPESPHDERKLVSILFVDLVGYTSRADKADPEDVRETLSAYHTLVGRGIEEFGGTVEKFIGDAIMAVFGAPLSHGDDAERAVRAGLRTLEAVARLDLSVHAAVNTGEAVVRVGPRPGSGEPLATGDVVNIAARLQSAAAPGSLIVGEETHRATRHAIQYSELPPVDAKGKRDPVRAWRAEAALTAPGERGLTRTSLTGREGELEILQRLWMEVVTRRQPHLVTIVGPPGIGKSRLVRELARRNAGGGRLLNGRCQPYARRSVYAAFNQQMRQVAGIFENDLPSDAREKLDRLVAAHLEGSEAVELGRYLPLLMGLGADEERSGRTTTVAPHEERVENRLPLFFAARRLVEGLGREQPTGLIFEDIHWADSSELDLIEYLAWHLKDSAVMLVALARPEVFDSRSNWPAGLTAKTRLDLEPLSRDSSVALAQQLLADPAQVAQITDIAEGNPLFIEELAAALSESTVPSTHLPASIKEAIAANIDSLPPEQRYILLDASVVGKTFWRGVLGAVSSRPEAVEPALEALAARGLIRRDRQSWLSGDEQFAFRHDLIHEVAYATLARSDRRALHGRVAGHLEQSLGTPTAEMAAALGHHWREAGDGARAVGYLLSAAESARRAWARDEADRLYLEALELVPETDASRRAHVRLMRGRALVDLGDFVQGGEQLDAVMRDLEGLDLLEAILSRARAAFWLEETEQVAALGESAVELATSIGAEELIGPALSFVAMAASTRGGEGDIERSIAIGDRALEVWVPDSRPIDLAIHKDFHAMSHYWVGRYETAFALAQSAHALGGDYDSIEALFRGGGEQAMAMVAMGRHAEGIRLAESLLARAQDIGRRWGSFVQSIWSMALRDIGELDQARRLNEEAFELASSVGAEFGATEQLIDLVSIDLMQGKVGEAQARLKPLRQRVDERKTWFRWLAEGRLAHAEAQLALLSGDGDKAIELAHSSIARAQRTKRPKYDALSRTTLGEALLKLGRPEDAAAELQKVVALADQLGSPPLRWTARAWLGRAEYALGDDAAAQKAFGEAAKLINDFAATLPVELSTSLLGQTMVREILKGEAQTAP